VLAATDPANPYGAALPWPESGGRSQPRRAAGAQVALVDGRLALYVEKGGRSLVTFTGDDTVLAAATAGIAELVSTGRMRSMRFQRIDGGAVDGQQVIEHLRAVGFVDGPKGLVKRS
jgi:ATP-dependent Lhr-like helicase